MESKKTKLACFLIDGVLALDAGSLTSQLTISQQRKLKAILLSHWHYDHTMSIPNFAFNNAFGTCIEIPVFASIETINVLTSNFLDGVVYPQFTEAETFLGRKTIESIPIKPFAENQIEGYRIRAIPVNHIPGAMGFEVISEGGKGVFYTGDTGDGLSSVWENIEPNLIIVDVTFPNKLKNIAKESRHLCPQMLKAEMIEFNRIRGYIPDILITHMNPHFEEEINREIGKVASELGFKLLIAREGFKLDI